VERRVGLEDRLGPEAVALQHPPEPEEPQRARTGRRSTDEREAAMAERPQVLGGRLGTRRVVEADVGARVRGQPAQAGGQTAGRPFGDPHDQLPRHGHVPVDDHEGHAELRRQTHRVAVADGRDGDDAVHPLVQEDLERLPLTGAVDV
jgi:hypothetical protein